jgi:hypothetical protein
MNNLTNKAIADIVRNRLKDCRPGGLMLEVVEEGIQKGENWWRVPVRPSAWPEKLYEYYEAMAEVEEDILENDNLNILFMTSEPVETPVG